MDTLGLGIVGAGVIFEDHAAAARALEPRLRLVAVAERDPERLARAGRDHFFPVATTNYEELLARHDVDIVAVCTPPATHEKIVITALEAGKYVLCEKPLAHNLAAADRIVAAAARYPGRLTVVYQVRYSPEAQRMLWLRESGHLGDLRFAHMIRFGGLSGRAPSWWGRWDVGGGGVAITQFIHELDLMCHLLGRPTAVEARMENFRAPIQSEDTISATVRFENGAMASCAATMAGFRWQQSWDLFGTQASAHYPWAFHTGDVETRNRVANEAKRRFPDGPGSRSGRPLHQKVIQRLRRMAGFPVRKVSRKGILHAAYYRRVLAAISQGGDMPVPPEEALLSQELCTAIYASALTGEAVDLPMDRSSPYCSEILASDHVAA